MWDVFEEGAGCIAYVNDTSFPFWKMMSNF